MEFYNTKFAYLNEYNRFNVFQCRQYVHVLKQFTARENPCKVVFAEKFTQKNFQ